MWYWVFKYVLLGPVARWYLRLRWVGRENLPRTGPFIVAANHMTMLDPVGISMGVPRRVTFLAKTKYYAGRSPKRRALAWFLRAIGQAPIDPASADAAGPGLDAARAILSAGGVVALFPEGTRSPDGRLYRGHTGVMRLALPLGVPVIPVGVVGTREVRLPGQPGPRRGRVTITYAPPLDVSTWQDRRDDPAAWREATDTLMRRIGGLSGQEYADRYPTLEERAARDRATGTED
ncbi:acyl-phosphate glycerol 3-phosphate acyltransferase [Intrasporangium oryzae NRRL B-24470]|uniref:Acyl-phosphate glycerol 3-phosphate acyltransferase n=1 Tax=Intrasporangium oryzae NRRL B-24470 TaxID=1386089 RepID=W9G3T1_9MICO|nr:lysophospholipid acyltransferase family protein [Intrasporangium oryzae]EWT00660.1 acyl-phosphate glycerol 3-phosphate acyltransferase [Intrasporangium oryzae NRRL B-24470]